jgi:hypothetical protein
MEMQASRQLAVTQQQAWDALNDPEVLKVCIPGCDKAVWRLDADGRVIRWDDYGDRFSQYGWLIHADPKAHWLAKALGVATPAPLHWRSGCAAA